MTEGPDETSEALKRIKQLENQNIKFKYLLEAAIDLASRDAKNISSLQNESDSLKTKVETLEREKLQLEGELHSVLEDNGSEIINIVRKLERENAELKTKFDNIVSKIKTESLDLGELKAEDVELRNVLMQLENEKTKLLQKIQRVGVSSSDISNDQEKTVFEVGSGKFSNTNSLEEQSLIDLLPTIRSLDDNIKHYVQTLAEQSDVKEKISELEHKNEELIKVVQKADSTDMRSQVKINEDIITTNTDFLKRVNKVRSQIEEISNEFIKTLDTPKGMVGKISQLENAKLMLYKELEQYLLNFSDGISKLTKRISDPEIKKLINEIEIQKTVLLYSLQTAKLNPYESDADQPEIYLSSVPSSTSNANINRSHLVSLQGAQYSETQSSTSKENKDLDPSTTKDDHQKLEEEVNRLELEKKKLLEQLRSISETSANGFNEVVTQNEIQMQTQSELHSTFMRESSHEIVATQNYDDATNQLYADEDARLEQRIRELEIENIRIQRELDNILEEIRADKSEMSRLQVTGQVLRERIDELEHNTVEKED